MTKVVVTRRNKHIVSVCADGHTGYGVAGEDIVCASLSSVIQTAALGLLRVVGLAIKIDSDEKQGKFDFYLPDNMTDSERTKADAILDTMLLGIADLNEGYSDFIELEVK